METTEVPSTVFQNEAGRYLDEAGKGPVFITRYNRRSRVLIDADEYDRLKALDTRRHVFAKDLPDDVIAELAEGYQGPPTPELEHLMD